ncbi:4-alpha-glucanotransferase [Anaerotignum propionicum]|uniref:4-alpha-glucanotransferase n=1 Tax=Anaerotignum propionicum TaxID=28446 RepID=UPI00210BFE53|nr:4-alpha-glucanotransferase [Anaerotignum propionicum]MCQ4935614.1 4-alpha-glucanotransferase [Anaerotignum propionicum]
MFESRKSGILLHPSSIPSPFGIGDFGGEAYHFIDELAAAKQTLWQILPLCPVDGSGSPYQSTSAFAGEPLFISLELLVDEGLLTQNEVQAERQEMLHCTDYSKARKLKMPLLGRAFENFKEIEYPKEYKDFLENNKEWLEDYALFMAIKSFLIAKREADDSELLEFLRETEGFLTEEKGKGYFYSACWCSFSSDVRERHPEALERWRKALKHNIQWECFLQYLFHKQWHALKSYANEKGIQIIGDAPIFVSYDSADVWANQKAFQLNALGFPTVVAGVPPDYFSETGQLWGNPLYQWKYHEKTGYQWWISRICKALQDVDILRIDHFRGFESYWEIPFDAVDARGGQWVKGPGKKLFRRLEKALGELPLIAEDLGIITEEVHKLRKKIGLPGMRILQFAFGQDKNHPYLPHCYDKNTVVYTGTHDNNTTLGWYENAGDKEKDHFRRYMNVTGDAPNWDMIRLAFASPACFAIIPLQDVLGLGEKYRMNQPGTVEGNWCFTFTWDMWQVGCTEGLKYLSDLFGRNCG